MKLSHRHIKTKRQFFSRLPVKKAYLFGSFSRNEADENSDIDILVELDHTTPIGMQFFTYGDKLQKLLNRKVDTVSAEHFLNFQQYFPNCANQVIWLYCPLNQCRDETIRLAVEGRIRRPF